MGRAMAIKAFLREAGRAFGKNWVLFIYMYVFPLVPRAPSHICF
jgi:hypothetical protein